MIADGEFKYIQHRLEEECTQLLIHKNHLMSHLFLFNAFTRSGHKHKGKQNPPASSLHGFSHFFLLQLSVTRLSFPTSTSVYGTLWQAVQSLRQHRYRKVILETAIIILRSSDKVVNIGCISCLTITTPSHSVFQDVTMTFQGNFKLSWWSLTLHSDYFHWYPKLQTVIHSRNWLRQALCCFVTCSVALHQCLCFLLS